IYATATLASFHAMLFAAHTGTVQLVRAATDEQLRMVGTFPNGHTATAIDVIWFNYHVHLRSHVADLRQWVNAEEIHKIPLGEQPARQNCVKGSRTTIQQVATGEKENAMSENNQAPTPEEMGAKLDEEIKETAQDWTDNPEASNFSDLNKRADVKVRRTLAGWVGADENADWKDVGAKMDENTRSAIAGWVGLEESADWPAITG